MLAALALLIATVAGLAVLWPHGEPAGHGPSQALGGRGIEALVTRASTADCGGPVAQRCATIGVRITEGRYSGQRISLLLGPVGLTTQVNRGDHILVQRVQGAPAGSPQWTFADIDRHVPLLWLVITFALLVVLLARWRGILALVGFALSLVLITRFLVPATLAGSPPVLVACVAAIAVMWVTLVLTYGLSPAALAAALGVGACLLGAAGLGSLWVHLADIDGRTSELGSFLAQQDQGRLSLQGIVLAGMIIGALGALVDTGVTQASAVLALRRTDPTLGVRALYREAFVIGRDHLTATIHTLVLAYVGAALPLILVLSSADVATGDAINTQDIAEPLVSTLIGAIALVACVPLTTALSAVLVARTPGEALRDGGHGHHHH